MKELLQMLSLPFGAELSLTVPEKTVEKIIQESAKGKVDISEVHCKDGVISFYVKKGILPKMNIQLGLEAVTLNQAQCILLLSDRKGNLLKLVEFMSIAGIKLPLKPYHDNLMYLDLTHLWLQKIKGQPQALLNILDSLVVQTVILPEFVKLKLSTSSLDIEIS